MVLGKMELRSRIPVVSDRAGGDKGGLSGDGGQVPSHIVQLDLPAAMCLDAPARSDIEAAYT